METDPIAEVTRELNGAGAIRVLHVDDEAGFADLVSIYLERANSDIEVVTEATPDDGVRRLAEADIDCIVSDYDMPRTNGLEFLEAVRADHPDVPFILFTGKGSEEIASEAISKGVTDYLQKQGGTDQYEVLANRIDNVVRQYRAEQEIDRGFQAMETAREGISLLDEEGTFIYVNEAYADTYGYDRDELVGEHWKLLYPDEHVEQIYDDILPSVPDTGRWRGESVHRTKDGDTVIVDHALAYADDDTLICLVMDITEEKRTERTLSEERTQFEVFVDAVEDYAIFSLDPEGYVTSWNTGAKRIKGYDAAEIVGEHFSTFYPDEKVAADYPDGLLRQALEDGSVEDRGWRLRADGSRFWADVVITAVFDDEGQHRGFLKVTRDISDRYRDMEALADQRRFIDQALDMLEDVFYVLDPDGRITRVTERAVEVTGYTQEELLSMDPTELFPADQRDRIRADIDEAFETGASRIEADLVTKEGERIPYEFRKRRFSDDDGRVVGVVGIGRDVTDRDRRERQLQRQLDQFEHFGSVLSHDLRNPLSTVAGWVELAQETGELEHLDRAEVALDRLHTLIDDLSTVMREGELVGDRGILDIGECASDVWASLPHGSSTLRTPDGCEIRADENALTRLLENLFKNSLEHGGDEVTVTVGKLPNGFYVEDDGPGIPEAIRDEVFEFGFTSKGEDEGTGLGLASARQIAVAHGWELTATDADGGGARFEVTDVEMA